MRKLILGIILSILLLPLIGQEDEIPNAQYFATPNVASFMKFEDIPVSLYNGNPDITIPVYTIQDGQINIPIKLRYNGSGIKVEEEASWVGLGWNLNAGGSITCRVNGKMDESWYDVNPDFHFFDIARNAKDVTPVVMYSPQIEFVNHVDVGTIAMRENYKSFFGGSFSNNNSFFNPDFAPPQFVPPFRASAMMYGFYKPDIYSFSTPLGSGSFYKDYDKNAFFQINAKDPIKIESTSIYKWIITDGLGRKFYFNTPQLKSNSYLPDYEQNRPITYYLDRIEYPNGQEVIFSYESKPLLTGSFNSLSSTIYRIAIKGNDDTGDGLCYGSGFSFNELNFVGEQYIPTYLSRIETDNIIVNFHLSDSTRKDIKREHFLDYITVTNKRSNDTLKKFQFKYSYFNESKIFYSEKEELLHKRLKLDRYNGHSEGDYTFSYNESVNLPSKKSSSRDYWGYCNGASSNEGVFLPDIEKLYRNQNFQPQWLEDVLEYDKLPSTNRGPDDFYMKAGILEKITYPTGGYTEFLFEPHTFQNQYYERKNANDLIKNFRASGDNSVEFTVSDSYYSKVYYSMAVVPMNNANLTDLSNWIEQCYVEFYVNNVLEEQFFVSSDLSAGGEFYYNFSPNNTYKFVSYWPPELKEYGYAGVEIGTTIHVKDKWSIGGGLRIAEIKSFSEEGNLNLKKKYYYDNGSISFGKLMTPLNFANNYLFPCFYFPGNKLVRHETVDITATSNIAISNAAMGSLIGYDSVFVVVEGELENGITKYSFHNEPSVGGSIFPPIVDLKNGLIQSASVYDKTNSIVEKTEYEYTEFSRSYYGISGNARDWSYEKNFTNDRIALIIYPIPASTIVPHRTIKTSFLNGKQVVTETASLYNNTNLQISRTSSTNSKGENILTYIKYPHDFTEDPILQQMVVKNILNKPVEQVHKINSNVVDATVNKFGANYQISEIYKLEKNHPLSDFITTDSDLSIDSRMKKTVTCDRYDSRSNLLQFHKDNGKYTTYLWAYNQSLPVAKIENATYDEVITSLGISYLELQTYSSEQLEDILNVLRNHVDMQESLVWTYTYIPFKGMTSQTDPNGVTTFFEYNNYGRLEFIKDNSGNILKNYVYNLKNVIE